VILVIRKSVAKAVVRRVPPWMREEKRGIGYLSTGFRHAKWIVMTGNIWIKYQAVKDWVIQWTVVDNVTKSCYLGLVGCMFTPHCCDNMVHGSPICLEWSYHHWPRPMCSWSLEPCGIFGLCIKVGVQKKFENSYRICIRLLWAKSQLFTNHCILRMCEHKAVLWRGHSSGVLHVCSSTTKDSYNQCEVSVVCNQVWFVNWRNIKQENNHLLYCVE
jgi:hypothetical protein